jgi:hypothetical protein
MGRSRSEVRSAGQWADDPAYWTQYDAARRSSGDLRAVKALAVVVALVVGVLLLALGMGVHF